MASSNLSHILDVTFVTFTIGPFLLMAGWLTLRYPNKKLNSVFSFRMNHSHTIQARENLEENLSHWSIIRSYFHIWSCNEAYFRLHERCYKNMKTLMLTYIMKFRYFRRLQYWQHGASRTWRETKAPPTFKTQSI